MDEREAWEGYYRDYSRQLFRYVRGRVGNHHDAEDIVADAFVRAAKHLDRLKGDPAYLYRTARNLVINRFSRAHPETPSSDAPKPAVLQTYPPLEEDPERAALLAQDQTEVRSALEQLTADQREALELRYFGELDSAAIGAVLGKTPGAVDVLTCRARLKLGHRLRLAQVDTATLPAQCWNDYIPRLSAHIDGKLKSPELEQTLAHLHGCEHCQTAYAAMQEAGRRLRVLVPPVLVLPNLTQRIGEQVAANAAAEAHRLGASAARRRRPGTRTLASAAVVVVTVVVMAFAVPALLARPVLDLTPKSLNFGQQTPLGASSEQTVTVTNRGTQPVEITALRVEGPDAGEFTITSTTCTQRPVPVGGTCSATIRFTRATEGSSTVALNISGRPKPWWLPG
ncbi:MAG: sigma-70 family RNA polymerase sigma factor [Egibacteraceae bacterium]